MPTPTHWIAGVSGNWDNAAYWSGGVIPEGPAIDPAIAALGTYTVTLSTAHTIDVFTLNSAGATFLQKASGFLNVGQLTFLSGTAILKGANTVLDTVLSGGAVQLGANGALGAGVLTFTGGHLFATANVSLSNFLVIGGDITMAAAHGKSLTFTGPYRINAGMHSLVVGDPTNDGTIIWNATFDEDNSAHDWTLDIRGGTLTGSGNGLAILYPFSGPVIVEAGATLDTGGVQAQIRELDGAGLVTNSQALAQLDLSGGTFTGEITGNLSVHTFGEITLSGANTYTGGTIINPATRLNIGDGATHGSVSGNIAVNGVAGFDRSGNVTIANTMSGTGEVVYFGGGTFTVNHTNSLTGITQVSGGSTLIIDRAASIGTSNMTLDDGTLRITNTLTLDTSLTVSGESAIEVAHGKTLTLDSTGGVSTVGSLTFGAAGKDGTVVWDITGGASVNAGAERLEIAAGTVRIGDDGGTTFGVLTEHVPATRIDAGATLDVRGWAMTIHDLEGEGTLTSSINGFAVIQASGAFSGAITGKLQLAVIDDMTLTGTCTYTLGTIVIADTTLMLGDGGTKGSVKGEIDLDGTLVFNHGNALNVGNLIDGGGSVRQFGAGTTTMTHANNYSGGTFIAAGTLVAAHVGTLGSGAITIAGGKLLSTVNQTFGNDVHMAGDTTIAAAHGITAVFSPGSAWSIDANVHHLAFGTAGKDGTVQWSADVSVSVAGAYDVSVVAGTLLGGGEFEHLFDAATRTTITLGATMNLNGTPAVALTDLEGAGAIANTGAAATLSLAGSNFTGTIGANITVDVSGVVTLSGAGNFDSANLSAAATLHLSGAAGEDVHFGGQNAVLILDTPGQFDGAVSGFVKTDKIDLTTIDFGGGTHFTFNAGSDVLSVTDGTHTANVQFQDGYHSSDFALSNDGHGHTFVTTTLHHAPLAIVAPEPFLELG